MKLPRIVGAQNLQDFPIIIIIVIECSNNEWLILGIAVISVIDDHEIIDVN